MIKAYFVGISTEYEGEDIEVRYAIFKDEELITKKTVFQEYVKPAVVNQNALVTLLKELMDYINDEITIIMNDPALNELLRGVSQTKNADVLKTLKYTRGKIGKFSSLTVKDISQDKPELAKWNEILQP